MGAKISSNQDEPISEINIVPFVDIILVVLIIFMVTTPFIMPSLNIKLPKASSAEETSRTSLNISIDAKGKVFFNGKPIKNESQIAQLAKQAAQKNARAQAVISADASVKHGTVVRVIDIIKSAGVLKFAISTERK